MSADMYCWHWITVKRSAGKIGLFEINGGVLATAPSLLRMLGIFPSTVIHEHLIAIIT